MNTPFFSILVVAHNAEETIKETLESALSQSFTDFEIIVKDALSKDDTLKRIPSDERIRVYSTKDGGIYDGMNEAIGYARGRFLHFLNCGDVFRDSEVLAHAYESAKQADGTGCVIYGDYSKNAILCKQPSQMSDFYLYRTSLNHQSMFFERVLFEKFGCYDTKYSICADYDFTLRTFRAGVPYLYCPYVICSYLGGGVSETKEGVAKRSAQNEALVTKHFSKKEIKKYKRKLFFSFRRLRQFLYSEKRPAWVRNLYRKLVNRVNG